MAVRRSALLPGALFLAALAAWPRILRPPAYLAPTATNVEASTASQAPAVAEVVPPAAEGGWRQKDWRKRRRPRRIIRHVGQRVWGKVLGFAKTKSGAAHVDVAGQECIMMPKDWTQRFEEGDVLEELWVRHIVEEKRPPLVFLSMKPVRFHSMHLRKDDKLRGRVLRETELGVYLDVGATHDALLFPNFISPLVNTIFGRHLEPGDEVDVWVVSVRKDNRFLVTTYGPRREVESFKTGERVTGVLLKVLPWGGAFVDVMASKDGFLPPWEFEDSALRQRGDRAEFYVTAFSKEKGLQLSLGKPRIRMEDLKAGRKITGRVVCELPHGGYAIDVGAVEDVMLNRLHMPEEGVVVGENITAWVRRGISTVRRGRISVTMKEPKIPSKQHMQINDWFTGTVENYNTANDDGGIFVDIGWVCPGLLPRQEFPPDLVDKEMPEAFKLGQEVQVRIVMTHRNGDVALSMRPAPAEPQGVA